MKRCAIVMILLWTAIGCARREPAATTAAKSKNPLTTIAVADARWKLFDEDDEELVKTVLSRLSAAAHPGRGVYRAKDYELVSRQHIPPQPAVPNGATILRAVAREDGVCEVYRDDLAATIFVVPGTRYAVLSEGIPSKGSWCENYAIYDIGRRDLLLVGETPTSPIGAGIVIGFWNVHSNTVTEVWRCGGEEWAHECSHSVATSEKGVSLTIYGILAQKQASYERERARLSTALGMPVMFVYAAEKTNAAARQIKTGNR